MIQIFPLADEVPERGARMKCLSFHQVSELQQGRLIGSARWLSVPKPRPKQRIPVRIGEWLKPRSQPAGTRAPTLLPFSEKPLFPWTEH